MRTIRTLVVSAIAVLLLGSCAFSGTATLYIYQRAVGSRQITSLYVYPWFGGPGRQTSSSSRSSPGELKVVYLVEPGPTTVEAVIDYGARTIFRTLVAEAGHTYMDIVFDD